MLIALSLFFLALFGMGPSYGKNVEKFFADTQHRVERTAKNEQAVKTMEAVHRTVRTFLKRANGEVKELSKRLSEHDAGREKFERIYEKMEQYNAEAQETVLKKREELKQYVTREEWGKVFGD